MSKILFISNIAGKRMKADFLHASINAAHALGVTYHSVANRSLSNDEYIKADEELYNIKLYHADINRSPFSLKNFTAYKQIKKIIEEEGIDYIHCNTPVGGVLGRLAGQKCGVKKIIYQAHGFHFYKGAPLLNWLIYYPIERLLAKYTDAIITINREDYEIAQKFKLKNKGKIYYVHGVGIDTAMYTSVSIDVSQKRKELGLKDDDIVLTSMGDLIKRKNYSVAIEAIAKANNKKLKYLICGKGPELENLKVLVQKLGVGNQVQFLGFRTDIQELCRISDIFLFTSLQEGLPRSTMEAMSSGLVCVASKIRGNTDLIEDGVNGYLCMPDDIDGFSSSINKIANDNHLKSTMKKNNLEKIKQFDVSVVEKEMSKIYSEVLI